MSKKDEALKLAHDWITSHAEHDQHCDVFYLDEDDKHLPCSCGLERAITAIREALAEQPARQEPVAWITQNGKGWLRWHKPEDNNTDSVPLYTSPPAIKPLTDEQINLFINGRGEEGDDDYVEPTGDGFGLTDADLVQLVRRVEAAHGIKGNA